MTGELPRPDTIPAGRCRAPRLNPARRRRCKPGDTSLDHPCAQNVAKDTRIGGARRIYDGNAALGHRRDRGASRLRRRPGFRRREIFAGWHEPQSERTSRESRLPRRNGRVARIHRLRRPFLRRIVVMVAVVTFERISIVSASVMTRCPRVFLKWSSDDCD